MKVTLELDCLSTETRHAIASETENSEVLDVLSADEKSYYCRTWKYFQRNIGILVVEGSERSWSKTIRNCTIGTC